MTMMQQQPAAHQSPVRSMTPRHPRRAAVPATVQYPEAHFSNLVGPLPALETVVRQWSSLVGAAYLQSTVPPRILALPPAALEYAGEAVRVAVVRHRAALGPALVNRLRAQLSLFRIADVVVEEGYFLSPAAPPSTVHDRLGAAESWSVGWEITHLGELRRRLEVPLAPGLLGATFAGRWESPRKIALIDTGDEGASTQIGFDTELTAVEQPHDCHGHGTAVGSLIRLAAPQVEVHSYRVMRHGDSLVGSTALLNAITSAIATIGAFHVVAIPQRANLSVQAQGQHDAIHWVISQNAERGYLSPVVVCAAGNVGPDEQMSYPATVPGVVVAVALDWSGRAARYNCPAPTEMSLHLVGAVGGTKEDPLGKMGRRGQPAIDLYGSSYATALVAGSLASSHAAT